MVKVTWPKPSTDPIKLIEDRIKDREQRLRAIDTFDKVADKRRMEVERLRAENDALGEVMSGMQQESAVRIGGLKHQLAMMESTATTLGAQWKASAARAEAAEREVERLRGIETAANDLIEQIDTMDPDNPFEAVSTQPGWYVLRRAVEATDATD